MSLPLEGIKVLDLCSALAGPLTSQLLGDQGAEVIKVERPSGDGFRGRLYESSDADDSSNPRWDAANRNKRSLVVDVHRSTGRQVYERLIRWADVLIENFRPGTPEKLGFGYERCKELNPGIIFVSLTGYGETGPWSRRAGSDPWAEALAGNVAVQGSPGKEPMLGGGTPFIDHSTPLALAYGIMVALHRRGQTGEGCMVTGSLLETALFLQVGTSFSDYLNGGELLVKSGRAWSAGFPQGAYTAADGEIVTMLVTDAQWDAFLHVLGLDELRGQPRFSTHEKRVQQRHELYGTLDAAFKKRTRAEWSQLFAETGIIRADPALRYDEVVAHPQVQATGSIIPVPHSMLGTVMGIAAPVSVDGIRTDMRYGPPALGEHSCEILAELGFSEAEIKAFVAQGAVFDASQSPERDALHADRERYAARLTGAARLEEG